MIKAIHTFPREFLWGTATAAHQVEGDNFNNDWWDWEQQAGRIALGHQSGKACDWWGGRWREDLERARNDGQNAHRLSIEWSRVEPEPGIWDEAALDHYCEILQGARQRQIQPVVTLHHFTNPLWLMESGGWAQAQVIDFFERYVRKVVSRLQDLVNIWVTINEPNVYLYAAYLKGLFPPGEKDLEKAIEVTRHLLLAHAGAYRTIHELQGKALVGLAHHYRGMKPARKRNPLDRWVTGLRSSTFNDLFPKAIATGKMRFLGRTYSMPEVTGTQDYFGLNYYTAERVAFDIRRPNELFSRGFLPADGDLSENEFIANDPKGMWTALQWARAFRLPVYITENGVEDSLDRMRPRYLAQHLRQVWLAVNFNWPVRGYFHWSLVDNFEWERGWTQRFGLYDLNVDTQERRKRPSGHFYSEVCQANGLSSEMVAKYAPEVFDEMFPGKGPGELTMENA